MEDQDANIFTDNIAKLQWACRRGMLELDVLLRNFLNEGYPALSDEEKRHFVELLSCPDPALFAWLMGRDIPENVNLAKMIGLIRNHAKSRI